MIRSKLKSARYVPAGEYEIKISRYLADRSPAILILSGNSVVARATVCLAEHGLKPPEDHAYIKTWAENEGILTSLVLAGLVIDTGGRVQVSDHNSVAALVKLSLKLKDELVEADADGHYVGPRVQR